MRGFWKGKSVLLIFISWDPDSPVEPVNEKGSMLKAISS